MLRRKNGELENCELCEKKVEHLVVKRVTENKVHVHAPFNNDAAMTDFIKAIYREWDKNSVSFPIHKM